MLSTFNAAAAGFAGKGDRMSHRSRQLRVSALARIEGEGALRVIVVDGQVREAELDIYEPPRFFEAFLRGRQYTEAPDITSRICGICPVAYQTSAWHAIEEACGAVLDRPMARCAGCCTAANGSPATPCTSTCCTLRTSSATRTRSRSPATTATSSSAGCG